jgi:uncharacterized membrane protein YbhN (UPF0104 family)
MIYFGFKGFGPTSHLSVPAALVTFVFSSLGMLVPTPGGVGSFHFLVTAALTSIYAIGAADAFSYANIQFIYVSSLNVLVGFAGYALLPFLNRKYVPVLKEG